MTAFFMMKKIALIYMGGTFGCTGEPLSPMPAERFIPQLKRVLPLNMDIECFTAPVIKDSSACIGTDWLELIQFIQQLQLKQFNHFVVIHGTDTLSYAAAVLSRFITQSAHVVLTGSQYPLLNIQGADNREFSDAMDNLNFALESVLHAKAGVYLAFHHQLLHAASVLKTHTTELNAFSGTSATAEWENTEKSHTVSEQDIEKSRRFNCLNLMMQPIATEHLLFNLSLLQNNPPDCLILQGFGTGNIAVNQEIIQKLQQIQSQGCPVILTTQVSYGQMDQRYAVSSWIKDAELLISDCHGHADLYAKTLKMYLQYDAVQQWHEHW